MVYSFKTYLLLANKLHFSMLKNKNSVAKKNLKGRTLYDILHEGLVPPNSMFSTLHFATLSSCIHVEFLNDERGKEKDS